MNKNKSPFRASLLTGKISLAGRYKAGGYRRMDFSCRIGERGDMRAGPGLFSKQMKGVFSHALGGENIKKFPEG